MVYHSTPDPNKTYGDHMSNFEVTKFEIHDAFFNNNHTLLNYVELTVTTFFPLEMKITRSEIIEFMKRQGNGFYFEGRKLILEKIGQDQFIHCEKSDQPRDILE